MTYIPVLTDITLLRPINKRSKQVRPRPTVDYPRARARAYDHYYSTTLRTLRPSFVRIVHYGIYAEARVRARV